MIKAFAFLITLPKDNQIHYMQTSKEITKEPGFIVTSLKNGHIYFVFDTYENALNARKAALNLDLIIKGGDIFKVAFNEECLSKNYQDALKNEAYDFTKTVIDFTNC